MYAKRILLSLCLLLPFPVYADHSYLEFLGRVRNSFDFYETQGQNFVKVGCLVQLNIGPEIVPLVIRSSDGVSCASMYRVNRKMFAQGTVYRGFNDIAYFEWRSP